MPSLSVELLYNYALASGNNGVVLPYIQLNLHNDHHTFISKNSPFYFGVKSNMVYAYEITPCCVQ
jgi:hypothetical protein